MAESAMIIRTYYCQTRPRFRCKGFCTTAIAFHHTAHPKGCGYRYLSVLVLN
jgi:hypothetical protein